MPKISFNGHEYDSPEAMPPDVRRLYEMAAGLLADKDGNGMPDIFEGAAAGNSAFVAHTTQFSVDGKLYSSLEELPPEARQKYEQAMKRFNVNSDGVPDPMAAGMFGAPPASATPASSPSVPSTPQVTVIGEGGSLPPAWIAAIAVIVLLAAAVVYLLLTR